MKKILILFILTLTFGLTSCSPEEKSTTKNNSQILGVWEQYDVSWLGYDNETFFTGFGMYNLTFMSGNKANLCLEGHWCEESTYRIEGNMFYLGGVDDFGEIYEIITLTDTEFIIELVGYSDGTELPSSYKEYTSYYRKI